MDERAAIETFLAANPAGVLHVPPPAGAPAEAGLLKAGIIPFLPAATIANWRIYVMRPRAEKPALGPPPFQLCKGTRMAWGGGAWQDLKSGLAGVGAEPLAVTALREGIEELGLKPTNLREWFDAGTHAFTSASSGTPKWMRMFAGPVRDPQDFLPDAEVAPTTAERGWLTLEEFRRHGRADYAAVAETVLRALEAY